MIGLTPAFEGSGSLAKHEPMHVFPHQLFCSNWDYRMSEKKRKMVQRIFTNDLALWEIFKTQVTQCKLIYALAFFAWPRMESSHQIHDNMHVIKDVLYNSIVHFLKTCIYIRRTWMTALTLVPECSGSLAKLQPMHTIPHLQSCSNWDCRKSEYQRTKSGSWQNILHK